MDQLDSRLIRLLRGNARTTVAELAHQLKTSRGTVTNRIRKLEREGTIAGYTLRLRSHDRPDTVRAWVSVMTSGSETRAVVSSLLGEPCVTRLHDTNGRWDLLVELEASSLGELSELLDRMRAHPGIETTETSIHLATFRG